MDEYDFYIIISGIISGIVGLSLKMCLKSRCEDVSLMWGCFNVHRNVVVEQDIENNQPMDRNDSTRL